MKWNWGTGIAATYIMFAAATSGFVVFAMSRPVSLVTPDYYAESLREDQLMAARANAQRLGSAVSIAMEGRGVVRLAVPRRTNSRATPLPIPTFRRPWVRWSSMVISSARRIGS